MKESEREGERGREGKGERKRERARESTREREGKRAREREREREERPEAVVRRRVPLMIGGRPAAGGRRGRCGMRVNTCPRCGIGIFPKVTSSFFQI